MMTIILVKAIFMLIGTYNQAAKVTQKESSGLLYFYTIKLSLQVSQVAFGLVKPANSSFLNSFVVNNADLTAHKSSLRLYEIRTSGLPRTLIYECIPCVLKSASVPDCARRIPSMSFVTPFRNPFRTLGPLIESATALIHSR